MRKIFIIPLIVSIIVFSFQTFPISGIYAVNEESNVTMDMESTIISESIALAVDSKNIPQSKFNEIIAEGKSTLLNVMEIEPNTPIEHSTITCLMFSEDSSYASEMYCDKIVVFGAGEEFTDVNNKTKYRATPTVSSSLLTAINEGIEKRIQLCYAYRLLGPGTSEPTQLSTIPCNQLYILYK
jgi:hypothetical protein